MILKVVLTWFCHLTLLTPYDAYRVLVVFPLASYSHGVLGHAIVNHLMEAGHEVVFITANPRNRTTSNLTEISVQSLRKFVEHDEKTSDMFQLKHRVGKTNFGESISVFNFCHDYLNDFLTHDNVLKLLNDPAEKFDVVLIEWIFSDITAGIAPLFDAPLIWFNPTEVHWQVFNLIDKIPNPSHSINLFSTFTPPLNFWERIQELWSIIRDYMYVYVYLERFAKIHYANVYSKIAYKRNVEMPPYEKAVYNGAALLINSHPSYGIPYKISQNVKYVGGFHIETTIPALPKQLSKLMDAAKCGVIYFSMGSRIKSSEMSHEMKQSLLKMFSKFNQTVIWKFEEDLDNESSNVHFIKWAPQQSILAHPNLKLFISHSGLLSTTEAVHYGVPIIGIPIRGDQFVNMNSIVSKGFGISVKLTDELPQDLYAAIREMLQNPQYKNKAKELSAVYHDRPIKPGKQLVYTVEHVAKTRGARYLRSPALQVPWYQEMFLDVFALVFLLVIIVLKIAKCVSIKRKSSVDKEKIS